MIVTFKRTSFLCFVLGFYVSSAREATFERQGNVRRHKFFEDREYDDGFAEYTGAEKKRMSDLQQRLLKEQEQELEDELFIQKLRRQNNLARNRDEVSKRREFKNAETDKDFDDAPFETERLFKETKADTKGLPPEDLALRIEEEAMKKEQAAADGFPGVGELFEEDIVMDANLRSLVMGEINKRDAVIAENIKWPGGVVPYVISDEIGSIGTLKRDNIEEAIRDFHTYTCIRLRPKEDADTDYINIMSNDSMCYSNVGRSGGEQNVSIGDGCERKGTAQHEIMHVLGFIHEQSRPDRDDYIEVLQDNIKPAMIHNFDKYPRYLVNDLDVPYDFDSVLHYNNRAFTKNGQDTIESREDPNREFGQRTMFSKLDVQQLNTFYECPVNDELQARIDELPYT